MLQSSFIFLNYIVKFNYINKKRKNKEEYLMNKDVITKFYQYLLDNPEALKTIDGDAVTKETLATLAKDGGFEINEADFEQYMQESMIGIPTAIRNSSTLPDDEIKKSTLSDSELDEISGGLYITVDKISYPEVTLGYSCHGWSPSDSFWMATKGHCGSCKYCHISFISYCTSGIHVII
jgi:hypothetical protein